MRARKPRGFRIRQIVRVPDYPITKHVRSALKRGYPDVSLSPTSPKLAVVASGPSAADFDLDRDIATLAINGSLRDLFVANGKAPTYWAACDPQPLVADFLDCDLPDKTIYLVASKCHPSVLDRLAGKRVMLWHVWERAAQKFTRSHRPIGVAVSVTVCAIELLAREGYTEIETWGWDACYLGGRHHVGDQPHNGAADIVVGMGAEFCEARGGGPAARGGEWFHTTGTWAAEAVDAVKMMILADGGYSVDVHGDGMIASALRAKGFEAPARGPLPIPAPDLEAVAVADA